MKCEGLTPWYYGAVMDHQLIVVGAGSAGCMAAGRAARRGLRVLLLDRREADAVGHPWVDDVEADIFRRLGLPAPDEEEAWPPPPFYRAVSPGGMAIEKRGLPTMGLRMDRFVRKLLRQAELAGVEFRGGTDVEGPLLDGGRVRGVVAGGEELPARLVLDASGLAGAVRRGLPDDSPVQREIGEECLVTAWREHRAFPPEEVKDLLEKLELPPGTGVARLGWRGGYSVLSLFYEARERILDILVGFKYEPAGETAGEFADRFLRERGVGGRRVHGGGGLIPVRRSLDVLVDHGLMLAGDAACMVLPAHGSGVASALIAGDLAAGTAAACLERGDTGRESLWEYGAAWQRGRGALMAYFDFIRLLSESLDEGGMDRLMGYAMTPLDLEIAMAARTLPLRPGDLLRRLKGLRHPLFLARFAALARHSMTLKKVYERYPRRWDPRELELWRAEVDRVVHRLPRSV
jgi:digeranylgeranylglycerophospholipid reductase